MFIYDEDVKVLQDIFQTRLNQTLGSTSEQLIRFLEDTDWAMVIKLHAVIEATVTEVIVAHTNQDALKAVIERLPLSDNQAGKGKIALDLDLITRSQYSFLRKFSELRNNLVHKVENLDFDLKNFAKNLDREQRKTWKAAISWSSKDRPPQERLAEIFDINPKVALFLATLTLVTLLTVDKELSQIKREVLSASQKTMIDLLHTT
ncbi:hypothetical protein F2A37_07700 [Pseudomonas chlororaphis]|uniref:hypothetical protein n=1 Tax=Pseudomonas chlororaphis TaxID=587753 RepID=UPI0012318A22|nr:hypothetical protein [Pseudomonas chlororaphis]KAA5846511.1 hypothetical protein F2A37_07700 [Pseudomonas chlororaphis]